MAAPTPTISASVLYTDAARTQVATAQQVIDAFSAGSVRISLPVSGFEAEATVISVLRQTIATLSSDGGSAPVAMLVIAHPQTARLTKLYLME